MTCDIRANILLPVDLSRLVAESDGRRIAWAQASEDLNLIVLQSGERIEPHRNDEADVLVIGVSGNGEITVDDATYLIVPTTALLIPRGTERGLCACDVPFAYLTCHGRRDQLWPKVPDRPGRAQDDEQ